MCIRDSCKIKPLRKLAFGHKFQRRRLQSRTGSRPSGKPKDPCRIPRNDEFSFLSSNPCGCPERNDLLPYRVFGMRARACQQRPARPEAVVYRVLAGLPRAKFRPVRAWSLSLNLSPKRGPKIFFGRLRHTGAGSLVLASGLSLIHISEPTRPY